MEAIKTEQNQSIENVPQRLESTQQASETVKRKPLFLIFIIVLLVIVVGFACYFYITSSRSSLSQRVQVTPSTEGKGILRVGETIDENGLEADRNEFQPFIDYLVAHLQQYGYKKGEFV